MNEVWKALDPIFQTALRTYVATGNQPWFELYAKAVGFSLDHIPLLYLTLQIELQFRDTQPNTDLSQYLDASVQQLRAAHSQMSPQQTQPQNYKNTHSAQAENHYLNISVFSDNNDNSPNQPEVPSITITNISSISTENTKRTPTKRKRTDDPAGVHRNKEDRTQKRRKVSPNDDDSNLRRSSAHIMRRESNQSADMKQEVMSSSEDTKCPQEEEEELKGNNTETIAADTLDLPSLHSTVFDAFDGQQKKTDNRKSYKCKPKVQPALPVFKLYRDSTDFDRYYELIRNGPNVTMNNQKEDDLIHKYQRLKQQNMTSSFKEQNTRNIAQSNKKKIGQLLAPLKLAK